MKKINSNGQIIGGAAETTSIIITKNGAIFHFATPTSAFFEFRDMELTNELCYREVLNYLKKYATNGIDLIVNGENVGYFRYSTNMPLVAGVGINITINDEHTAIPCGMKRWSENARNIMAADLKDYINELENEAELDEFWALNDEANEMTYDIESEIESIETSIGDAKGAIKISIEDGEIYDSDMISCHIKNIKESLDHIKESADCFIARACRITNCDFTFYDWFDEESLVYDLSEAPVGIYLPEFRPDDLFSEILDYLFEDPSEEYGEKPEICEELLNLKDTLYHYLAVA